jgi:hypothetical protein
MTSQRTMETSAQVKSNRKHLRNGPPPNGAQQRVSVKQDCARHDLQARAGRRKPGAVLMAIRARAHGGPLAASSTTPVGSSFKLSARRYSAPTNKAAPIGSGPIFDATICRYSTIETRSWFFVSSAVRGSAGSCSTVASWPSRRRVRSTTCPSGNSSASWWVLFTSLLI